MSSFKIEFFESKPTKDGKAKAEVLVKDEAGQTFKATLWGDFPDYENLMAGHMIEGQLWPASDPKYLPSIKPMKVLQKPNFMRNTAPTGIAAAMEVKKKNINEFQDRKEVGMSYSNAMNVASAIVNARVNAGLEKPATLEDHIKMVEDTQDHFLKRWDEFSSTSLEA